MKPKTQDTPSNHTLVLLCGEGRRMVVRVELAIKKRSPWVNVYYEITLQQISSSPRMIQCFWSFQHFWGEPTVLSNGPH